jgi:iron complex outermembrane receptor protein
MPARRLSCLACLLCLPALAQSPNPHDLSDASLEELLDVQVTSVSKKEQKLSRTGAAIFVMSHEDIRRSGATNIPDLLRMAPGVSVARIDAHTWAISIRGLNDRFSDNVLVAIDGRSVYTPLWSGVNWDQQDVPLEDIDRIEVIRGPGGTVWGANAVNGVINILTKSAQATKGGLAVASGGSQEQHGLTQYGAKAGDGAYRVFANYSNIENSAFPGGSGMTGTAADGSHTLHGGFRSDWNVSPRDSLTVQGDVSQLGAGQTIATLFSNNLPFERVLNDKVTAGASDILGRWNRALSNGSEMSLQVYYDRYNRLEAGLREIRDTEDVDFHQHVKFGGRNDIVWGLGYRITSDRIDPGYATSFNPARRTDNLLSTFFQDEIRIADSVSLTVGSKFEHNGYTGFEYEPSVQLVWSPTARQEVWASAARAIRQPSRSDVDAQIEIGTVPLPGGGFGILRLYGDPHKQAEQVYDYEIGYRAQAGKHVSVDVAAFLNFANGIETMEPGVPFLTADATPHLIVPLSFDSKAHSSTRGGEIFANWSVTNHWKISPGYSLIHEGVNRDAGSKDTTAETPVANTPRHRFEVRSFLTMPHGVEGDGAISYTGSLREDGTGEGPVPGFMRLDARLAKRIGESAELSVVGQNLLTPRHVEFHDSYGKFRTVVSREVFARIAWRF